MSDLICPYNATFAQKDNYSCPKADEVIRRGGSEYVCLQADSHRLCCEVHDSVKQAYLDSEALEDDLLTLPHSTYVKIQFGCVLGLQSALGRDSSDLMDIGSLISDAIGFYKITDDLPYGLINETISTHKLQKRGKRK